MHDPELDILWRFVQTLGHVEGGTDPGSFVLTRAPPQRPHYESAPAHSYQFSPHGTSTG